jgi:internalin A
METDHPTVDQPAPAKSHRRWYQYSLRTLLIVVTLFALACSWFAVNLGQARRQREAVEAIVRLGGGVTYDYELRRDLAMTRQIPGGRIEFGYESDLSGMPIPKEPSWPLWLRKLLGDDFFNNVVKVRVENDAAMVHLARLPHLRKLETYGEGITDAGMEKLEGMLQLEQLNCHGIETITDDGLISLADLPSLRYLLLASQRVSDTGVERIARLVQLRRLTLSSGKITDEGVKHLAHLTNLKELDLSSQHVTDKGLQYIVKLSQLEKLDLQNASVTDAGLETLTSLPQLRSLHLIRTKVSDAGLACLVKFPQLRCLSLGSRQFTARGVRHLKSLPGLRCLELDGSEAADAELELLSGLTQLESLSIFDTDDNVSGKAIHELQKTLPKCEVVVFGALVMRKHK